MGLFSRKKSASNQEIEFLGVSGQASTLKCLLLAGVRGVSLRTTFAPSDVDVDHVPSYQYLAPFEKAPMISQGDFSVSGARAIQTYLDIRGKGASLYPRKARVLGQQNYWIEVCYKKLAPAVQDIVKGGDVSDDAKVQCNEVLSSLDKILGENLFVAGPLTLADPNVAAFIYVLRSHDADLSPYSNIKSWITRLEGEISDDLKNKYLPLLSLRSGQQAA